jgi:hypothetical protein
MQCGGVAAAGRRALEVALLGVLPVLAITVLLIGAAHARPAFDFHGVVWQAGRDVLDGRSPYPPATREALAIGNRFLYPAPLALLSVPFALLPFAVAAALFTAILICAMALALWLFDVRDWRCYGAAFLALPVEHDLRLGALTPLLLLAVAAAWRWRDRTGPAAAAVGAAVVAKLFLWPVLVWLVLTGRRRTAVLAVAGGLAACFVGWAVISFAGLGGYPHLLAVVSDIEQGSGYSPIAAGLALGLGPGAARLACLVAGLVVLVLAARAGDERRTLGLAVLAGLILSPVVWLHYFVLLFAPIALLRPRFSAAWLLPSLLWLSPAEGSDGNPWRLAVGVLALVLAVAVAGGLGRRARSLGWRDGERGPALPATDAHGRPQRHPRLVLGRGRVPGP